MKYALILTLATVLSCTKSETQYKNQEDRESTVNDRRSDTIQTLNEVSDTVQLGRDSTNVKTDNE